MGRLAGPFGVRGWIRVVPFTADVATLLDHRRWLLAGPQGWTGHEVVEARMHGGAIIAQVTGIVTREEALARKGSDVGVPRDSLPPPAEGEAYWADLDGLSVVNRAGVALGTVVELRDNGAHGLLRVRGGDGRDRLIPYVPAIVDSVDFDERRIVVDWDADW
jgi:16S rRNA processing protein RimM